MFVFFWEMANFFSRWPDIYRAFFLIWSCDEGLPHRIGKNPTTQPQGPRVVVAFSAAMGACRRGGRWPEVRGWQVKVYPPWN